MSRGTDSSQIIPLGIHGTGAASMPAQTLHCQIVNITSLMGRGTDSSQIISVASRGKDSALSYVEHYLSDESWRRLLSDHFSCEY